MLSEYPYEEQIPMVLTKNKRDEFLIEIRKSKSQNIILQKRMRLGIKILDDQFFVDLSESLVFPPQDPQQEAVNSELYLLQVQAQLDEMCRTVYNSISQQDWKSLIGVIQFLREGLCHEQTPFPGKFVIDRGIIPHLVSLLGDEFSGLQDLHIEISWLFLNLSAGPTEDITYLVEQNVIPTLSKRLRNTNNTDLQENIIWSLANISAEPNLDFRDHVLKEDVIYLVVKELGRTPKTPIYNKTAALLFANVMRGTPYPSFEKIENCFGALAHLIKEESPSVIINSLKAIQALTEEAQDSHLKSLKDYNIIKKVLTLVDNKDEEIAIRALKIVKNILKGKQIYRKDWDLISLFQTLSFALINAPITLKKELCKCLSEIISHEGENITFFFGRDTVNVLFNIIALDEDEAKIQALECLLSYLSCCSPSEAFEVIQTGIVEILIEVFRSDNERLLNAGLECLIKTFKHENTESEEDEEEEPRPNSALKMVQNNWVCFIEDLLAHPDYGVAQKAGHILDTYFNSNVYA